MGVIRKVLYRDQVLGKPRHRNLFLDMEENIHIHYRDLRIELSRGEFEDIAAAFNKQSRELLDIIQEKQYQDGELANANQEDVRIWTESRLKHGVKYHPQRISLEECSDGYHFHYRNYKLLIDPKDFRQVVNLFRSLDVDAPYASTYDEVLELLEVNEIDFKIAEGDKPGERLVISAAPYHLPKIRDILVAIGFTQEREQALQRYIGDELVVEATPEPKGDPAEYRKRRGMGQVASLEEFLIRHRQSMDPNTLNDIQCQVIELFYSMQEGDKLNVDPDPTHWLYSEGNRQVIFPFSSQQNGGESAAKQLYLSWRNLLKKYDLAFIKPIKDVFANEIQNLLKQEIEQALLKEAGAFRAVRKIHIMGSAMRGDMGAYQVPFVHGKLVKLGSDIDVLIELDGGREDEIPPGWSFYVDEASNHCAIYHLGSLSLKSDSTQWRTRYPHIPFQGHLLDAYVHLPSRGYEKETAAFLEKFGAKCLYDRDEGRLLFHSDQEQSVSQQLASHLEIPQPAVEPMKVSTENQLYRVFIDESEYILKLFKASGNYPSERINEHVDYETALVDTLVEKGVPTAGIRHKPNTGPLSIDNWPALLFTCLPGKVEQRPEYPIDKMAPALAHIHQIQLDDPLTLPQTFGFDDICMLWLPQFHRYQQDTSFKSELIEAIQQLAPLVEPLHDGKWRGQLYQRVPHLHCHGDVTPKNVIMGKDDVAYFFDFNNAFYGPRIIDVLDGAFEFSLAEKYIHMADFKRFDRFIEDYQSASVLTSDEQETLAQWTTLLGLIKFTKEIRVATDPAFSRQHKLRGKRALKIAEFLQQRLM